MKKIFLVISIIIFLSIGILFQLNKNDSSVTNDTVSGPQEDYVFPTNTNSETYSNQDNSKDEIILRTSAGNQIEVVNFIKNGTAIPDHNNDEYYFIGDSFSEVEGEPNPNYIITYIKSTQFFNITLLNKPLSSSRLQAESYLSQKLNLSEEQLCQLNYTLSTPGYVDETYSGINLGFSFCSGSTEL